MITVYNKWRFFFLFFFKHMYVTKNYLEFEISYRTYHKIHIFQDRLSYIFLYPPFRSQFLNVFDQETSIKCTN